MRILLDVDGVICDYQAWWCDLAEKALGRRPTLNRPDRYGMHERYNTDAEDRATIDRLVYTTAPDRMHPMPGAIEGVRMLTRRHDVHFVTTSQYPNPLWEYGRRAWFHRELGADASMRLCFVYHKRIVDGDVFVDDLESNVKRWLEGRNTWRRGIVFGSPTCPDWSALLRQIGGFTC